MKSILMATAVCLLCAGFPNSSIAGEEAIVDSGTASVETMMTDLERRIEQLEAKIGGEAVESAFQPRGSRALHLRVSSQASSLD